SVHGAIGRLTTGETHFEPEPVLVVGVAGLVVNLGSAWVLARSAGDNLNVRGALIHMLADALGSVGAILAAVLASVWGLHAADSVLSLAIAALVVYSAWGVLRDATRALLDFAPADLPQDRVETALRGLSGLQELHELHLWSIGDAPVLTAHLVPEPGVAAGDLLARAEHLLREHLGIVHTTLQIDDPGPCAQRNCPLFDERLVRVRPHGHDHGHGHGHGHAH
ncbi:MAG TPA: cation diffusion facilitator family transporter, partial [Nannocystis sp.]